MKIESGVSCDICYQNFDTPKLRHAHYTNKHSVQTGTYGCSSCIEQHADEEENRLHHETVHKKKRVGYKCPLCSTTIAYSLTKFNAHLASCVDPFYNTVDLVDNITCAKCRREFETKNLFDWHGCFIANKRPCPKCKRVFVKKATLWRHIFACDAIPVVKSEPGGDPHMVQIPNINISADSKRPKKTTIPPIKINMKMKSLNSAASAAPSGSKKVPAGRSKKMPSAPKKQASVSFKAEPETILEPVVELEQLLEPVETVSSVHGSIVSPVGSNGNEGDLFGFDAVDTHFGDDADSDADHADVLNATDMASALPSCTVNLEMFDFADFSSITINNVEMLGADENGLDEDDAFDDATQHDDNFDEDEEQTAADTDVQAAPSVSAEVATEIMTNVEPEPSTSQAAEARHSLTMRIKREVMHSGYGDPVFNPTLARIIKREKGAHSSPVQRTNARKSTAKPTYTIIHSSASTSHGQQLFDPVLARNIKREKGAANQPDDTRKSTPNIVTAPATRPSGETVSGGLFDPMLARNIKKERGSDVQHVTARKSTTKPAHTATISTPAFDPLLARNIKREKGVPQQQQHGIERASTSSVDPIAGPSNVGVVSDSPTFDPILARNIKREKDLDKQHKTTLRPNPIAVASTMADKPTKVSKKMYKMALLAEKIRQERLAREAHARATLSTEETSNSSTSSQTIITHTTPSGINDDTSSSNNSTPLPFISEVMDANKLERLTSDSNEIVLPVAEQTSELAELIPFKPIRLSTEFKKSQSSSSAVIAQQSTPDDVAEDAEHHSSKSEVPFTISKVVSLTSIDAIECQPMESETNEKQSEYVECDKNHDEVQDDEMNENLTDETNQQATETANGSAPSEWIANESPSDDIRTNETHELESEFQSKMSVDTNTIMASLEAIEQIVTELEKSENNIVAEVVAADAGYSVTNDVDKVDDAFLPMDTVESDNLNDNDRIAQAETDLREIESEQILPNTSLPTHVTDSTNTSKSNDLFENEEADVGRESVVHGQQSNDVGKSTLINDSMELDDISEDSLGLCEPV